MTKPILVPLRGSDRIELYLNDLEHMARPGTKVVFFVHYGLAGFQELMDQLLAVQLGARPEPLTGTSNGNPPLGDRVASGERTILPALDALKKKGVQIEVNLYGLTKTLQEYVKQTPVYLVTRPEPGRTDEDHDHGDPSNVLAKLPHALLSTDLTVKHPL